VVEKEGKAGQEEEKGTRDYSRILAPEEEKEYPLKPLHLWVDLLRSPPAQGGLL
jgi:hypothetical protein